jgi:excisionase family DNA binding protein
MATRDESDPSASAPIMTTLEITDYLRINRGTLYRLVKRGQIPCFRVGNDYRFSRTQITEWLGSGGSRKPRPKGRHRAI